MHFFKQKPCNGYKYMHQWFNQGFRSKKIKVHVKKKLLIQVQFSLGESVTGKNEEKI